VRAMLMASVRRRTGLFRCLRTERWVNGFTMERRACLDVCVLCFVEETE
jgi:hypothetical protein